ncbi:hypothetical protein BHE74_00011851 [Ensete ventricosum]|nr:hypothetical protein GW17_00034628 [Ensete ventricosum]RWW79835.1 hypothetical protein BHE74_00011851 [Ensete ventricosum]
MDTDVLRIRRIEFPNKQRLQASDVNTDGTQKNACTYQTVHVSYPIARPSLLGRHNTLKDGFAEGKDLVVTVMSAMGEEQICALKDIGPK